MRLSLVEGRNVLAVVVVTTLAVAPAHAAPGDGIQVGDVLIRPTVATGLEYHSNIYLSEGELDGGGGTPTVAAMVWYLKPSVTVALKAPKLELDFTGGYGIRAYIDLDTKDDYHPENLDRFSDFDLNLGMYILPKSKLGFKVDDKFMVGATPGEVPAESETSSANVVHLKNDLVAGAVVRPGSALDFTVKGHFGFDQYDLPSVLLDSSGNSTYFNNRLTYGPALEAGWSFLPKTKFQVTGAVDWLNWDQHVLDRIGPEVSGSDIGDYIGKPDSLSWRAKAGVKGQITQKLAVVGTVGYGQSYYDEQTVLDAAASIPDSSAELSFAADGTGNDFGRDLTDFSEGFLVDLQVGYAPIESQKFTAGYRKDFLDTVFSNYVLYNYWYVRYAGTFVKKVATGAELSYRVDAYHGEVTRTDQSVTAKASLAYSFTDWMSLGVQGGWSRRACWDSECENGQYYTTQYDDFFGQLGATFKY